MNFRTHTLYLHRHGRKRPIVNVPYRKRWGHKRWTHVGIEISLKEHLS